jgi:formyltetrahydrofolate deformylase
VAEAGGNIVEADQHSDPEADLFLQRIEFDVATSQTLLASTFAPIAERFAMDWEVHDLAHRPRVAILASRQGHCLGDLLVRFALGELAGEVVLVASNHDAHVQLVSRFGLGFHVLPVADDTRDEQERAIGGLLEEHAPDVVVLARYMRILPPWIVERWAGRMINIHHSFLP